MRARADPARGSRPCLGRCSGPWAGTARPGLQRTARQRPGWPPPPFPSRLQPSSLHFPSPRHSRTPPLPHAAAAPSPNPSSPALRLSPTPHPHRTVRTPPQSSPPPPHAVAHSRTRTRTPHPSSPPPHPHPSSPSRSLRCGARPSRSRALSLSVSEMWHPAFTLQRRGGPRSTAALAPAGPRAPSLCLSPFGGVRPFSSLRCQKGAGAPDPATSLRGEAGSRHPAMAGTGRSPAAPSLLSSIQRRPHETTVETGQIRRGGSRIWRATTVSSERATSSSERAVGRRPQAPPCSLLRSPRRIRRQAP